MARRIFGGASSGFPYTFSFYFAMSAFILRVVNTVAGRIVNTAAARTIQNDT